MAHGFVAFTFVYPLACNSHFKLKFVYCSVCEIFLCVRTQAGMYIVSILVQILHLLRKAVLINVPGSCACSDGLR